MSEDFLDMFGLGVFDDPEDQPEDAQVDDAIDVLANVVGDTPVADINRRPLSDPRLSSYTRAIAHVACDGKGNVLQEKVGDQFFRKRAIESGLYVVEGSPYERPDRITFKGVPDWFLDSYSYSGVLAWRVGLNAELAIADDFSISPDQRTLVPVSEELAVALDVIFCHIGFDMDRMQRFVAAMHLFTTTNVISGVIGHLDVPAAHFMFLAADLFRPSFAVVRRLVQHDPRQFEWWLGMLSHSKEGPKPWTDTKRLYVLVLCHASHSLYCSKEARSCSTMCLREGIRSDPHNLVRLAQMALDVGDTHTANIARETLWHNIDRFVDYPTEEEVGEMCKPLESLGHMEKTCSIRTRFAGWNLLDMHGIQRAQAEILRLNSQDHIHLFHVCPVTRDGEKRYIATTGLSEDDAGAACRCNHVISAVEGSLSFLKGKSAVVRMSPVQIALAPSAFRDDMVWGAAYVHDMYACHGKDEAQSLRRGMRAIVMGRFLGAHSILDGVETPRLVGAPMKTLRERQRQSFLSPAACIDLICFVCRDICLQIGASRDLMESSAHNTLLNERASWKGNPAANEAVIRDLMHDVRRMVCPIGSVKHTKDDVTSFGDYIEKVYDRNDQFSEKALVRPHEDPFSVVMMVILCSQGGVRDLDENNIGTMYYRASGIMRDPEKIYGVGFSRQVPQTKFDDYMDSMWEDLVWDVTGNVGTGRSPFAHVEQQRGAVPPNEFVAIVDQAFCFLTKQRKKMILSGDLEDLQRTETLVMALYTSVLLASQGRLTHDFYGMLRRREYREVMRTAEMLLRWRSPGMGDCSSGAELADNEEAMASPGVMRFVLLFLSRKILF